MATKAKSKWTPAQIKEHTKRILQIIEKQRRESKAEHFTSVTPEEIERKFKRVNSPMIVFQSWNSTAPGGTVDYTLGIYNPDPVQASSLFAHVCIGSGNVDPVIGTFLENADTRFPRLTEPAFFGLSLAPGASANLSFALRIPASVERTKYLGNSCLMQFNWHDVGLYLDRSVFVFAVS
jgi:hypothetical protein